MRFGGVAVAVLALAVLASAPGCSSEPDAPPAAPDPAATAGLPSGFGLGPATGPCRPVPTQRTTIDWLPDLPLPEGTFVVEQLPEQAGLRRAILATPVTYNEFASYALNVWPDRGWILGQGETELGEAETSFIKGSTYGAFRARDVYCEDWAELLLAIGSSDLPAATTTLLTTTTTAGA